MKYQIEIFPNGQASLRDHEVCETMHSSIGPWEEAQEVYIKQSGLRNLLSVLDPNPLVIYDVGMGIAANALSVLAAVESETEGPGQVGVRRDLILYSFEKDLQGVRQALKASEHFKFLLGHRAKIEKLLESGVVEGHRFQWRLLEGDFRKQVVHLPVPDLVYYDFYSPKSCPELWGYQIFKDLYQLWISKQNPKKAISLYTYSCATSVRTALLLAGFYVGAGVSTDSKRETTVATTDPSRLSAPLGSQWLEHWRRSSKALPWDSPSKNVEEIHQVLAQKLHNFSLISSHENP